MASSYCAISSVLPSPRKILYSSRGFVAEKKVVKPSIQRANLWPANMSSLYSACLGLSTLFINKQTERKNMIKIHVIFFQWQEFRFTVGIWKPGDFSNSPGFLKPPEELRHGESRIYAYDSWLELSPGWQKGPEPAFHLCGVSLTKRRGLLPRIIIPTKLFFLPAEREVREVPCSRLHLKEKN